MARRDHHDSEPQRRHEHWPTSAILTVAGCAVAILVLALLNVLGIQLGSGPYQADVGGSVAEWSAAVATLVALPTAVLTGVRQIGAQSAATDLFRRQLAAEEEARERERDADLALVLDAIELRVEVTNAVDRAWLASPHEQAAIGRWRDELTQRGWVANGDGATWWRNGTMRTNADQLTTERSPLLREPWWVAIDCHNASPVTVVIERWAIDYRGRSTVINEPAEIRRGDRFVRRLGKDEGLATGFPNAAKAAAAAEELQVVVEGRDIIGRPLRIEHVP
jgi:hypothetical protein